jgi:hypothetical protein
MATRYTCNKVPGMAVTIGRDGIEKSVLEQFCVIDDSITWSDVESADLHDQYNVK